MVSIAHNTETMTVKGKSPEHAIAQMKKGHMNREKGEFSIHEDTIAEKFEELLEKNVPTNPKLWSKFKDRQRRSLMYILLHMPTVGCKKI